MGIRSLCAVAAMTIAMGATGSARAETLADALAYTYEHSGLIEQNRALLRAADEDVAQAVADLLPVVNWTASAGYATNVTGRSNDAYDYAASLSIVGQLLLYDGGVSQASIDAQKETVLATRQQLIGVEQQALFRTVAAYMEVRRQIAFVDLRQNNVRVITQEVRAARDRFDVGEVTRTDVALAEARLAAARSAEAGAQGALTRAKEEFRAAVGRAPGQLQPASGATISRSLEDAQTFALRSHPSLRAAQHSVTATELAIRAAEASTNATVNLDGRLSVDESFNEALSVGISAGGPIYAGGAIASAVRQAYARRDSARAGLHIAQHDIRQNVANAYAILGVSRASREAFDRQVRAAQTAFRGVREEATLGSRTTLDVLNAEQELLDARANLISAQVDEIIASYTVLSTMGLLTADHLNLNVELYDPTAYYNLVKDSPAALSDQGRALDRVLQAIGD
ncbi:TolC family outer membrane protein [Aestuariibius sp. HNIBRBA575]|uniref:TolC family outer membrane protein n=1 Tax=Aestuariibius sp. HNIBRBA575 TaxID=3233343 RepID=UPI0034A316CE